MKDIFAKLGGVVPATLVEAKQRMAKLKAFGDGELKADEAWQNTLANIEAAIEQEDLERIQSLWVFIPPMFEQKPVKMESIVVVALKELIENCPGSQLGTPNVFEVGIMLDSVFKQAGYELELHQLGVQGTKILAVKRP